MTRSTAAKTNNGGTNSPVLIVFPNAKINLGLQVTGRRPDGFHDIATVFYPVALSDVLEAVRSTEFSFSCTGLPLDAGSKDNLCIRAWEMLQHDFALPPVAMHLHKVIPMGAGLGGGSSDGAFTLLLLNQLFQIGLSIDQLSVYALQLGSDCPFFLLNKPAFATGRGEQLSPIGIPSLAGKKILLVNPGLHINTGWAFRQLQLQTPSNPLPDVLQLPPDQWKGRLINDFEAVAFAEFPLLPELQEQLYGMGAVFAGMTGTGSTMFGIFNEAPENFRDAFPSDYFIILQ